jgi:hypothetical protein
MCLRDSQYLARVTTPEEERAAALAAYKSARDEFDAAQEQWEQYLDVTGANEIDPIVGGVAFDRLKSANQARDDALDFLWIAWRNRPEPVS